MVSELQCQPFAVGGSSFTEKDLRKLANMREVSLLSPSPKLCSSPEDRLWRGHGVYDLCLDDFSLAGEQ